MPAGLPGTSATVNRDDNPAAGRVVTFDPTSGPKGSPFDAKVFDYSTGSPPGWDAATNLPILIDNDDDSGVSTGGLSTGIGFGAQVISKQALANGDPSAPVGIFNSGFNDNGIPGEVYTYAAPPPVGVVSSNAILSTRMYIGGGRSVMSSGSPVPGAAGCDPYDAGIAICGAGNSGARDGGAGPAFTGFPLKAVTAAGSVANGAAIEAGWVNRAGVTMVLGQSAHGIGSTELAAPS